MNTETTTLIILMAAALVMLVVVVGMLVLHLFSKDDELRQKNDVIVREVRRNQELIERAVKNGVKRAAMFSSIMLPFLQIT
jgi:sensor domain CHASE-containing protein